MANAAVVQGVARGYTDAGYADRRLLHAAAVVAGRRRPRARAAGVAGRRPDVAAEATRRCGDEWVIQGGEAVLGQWVAQGRDMNITCPGVHLDLAPWFQQLLTAPSADAS